MFQNLIVNEYEIGLLYSNGRFVRALSAGQYRVWNILGRNERIQTVDTRLTTMAINGQEMLTADKVTLRLNLVANYRVIDAALAINSVQNYVTALYTEVQLALRSAVTAVELDVLMADREALATGLRERVRPLALIFGLSVEGIGVRDVILPGEVKKMLAREAEALREGRAALVAAREETATVRATLNTARLLDENPVLMQMRGWQSLEAVAEKPGNTVVLTVPGSLLKMLEPLSPE